MAYNPLKVLSDFFVKEQAVLKKGMVVSGSISGSNTTGIYVKKDLIVDGDVELGGVVTSAGHAQVGAFQVDGTFDVAGLTSLSGTVSIAGNTNVDGTVYADQAVIDDVNVQNNFYVGNPQFLAAKKGGQNNASISYFYTSGKLFIAPELVSGSLTVFASSSIVDMHTIDSSIPSGTMAVDIAKSLNSVDDYLIRLRNVIEF